MFSFLPKVSPYIKHPDQVLRLSNDSYYPDEAVSALNYRPKYYQVNNIKTIKCIDIFDENYIKTHKAKTRQFKTSGGNFLKFSPLHNGYVNSKKKVLNDYYDNRVYSPKYEAIDKHLPGVCLSSGPIRFKLDESKKKIKIKV